MADYYVREEDGTSKFVLEDSSGDLLLEDAIFPGFIASVTQVYAPLTNPMQFPASGTFTPPPGVPWIQVYAWGAGGGGGGGSISGGPSFAPGGGGGGAALASGTLAVTPGTPYTVTVGAAGSGGAGNIFANASPGTDGGDSSFTGDSASVVAKGGKGGQGGQLGGTATGGAGGLASGSTGTLKNDGGSGANGVSGGGSVGGEGGGGAGGTGGAGSNGSANSGNSGGAGGGGGSGTYPGGHGGQGGDFSPTNNGINTGLTVPGGGGGGACGTQASGASGANGFITISWSIVVASFIPSVTTFYAPNLPIPVPFIASVTRVRTIFSIFSNLSGSSGPGNGGEVFTVQLAPNGTSQTASLAGTLGPSDTLLSATGDSGFPSSGYFVVTIDSEVLYLARIAAGSYRIVSRAVSNTTAASHAALATITWNDTYDQAIVAGVGIAHNFTANIGGTGSFTYPGWLISFDSTQAYIGASRYPMHVTNVLGVFTAGAGSGGTNKLDAAQPNAIATTAAVSDDCPAALSNPARISSDIATGDVALVRFTNPEASIMTLGPRAVSLQSWFGLKRVSAVDADVTFTDTTGYVVDTNPGTGRFAACANAEFLNPSSIGINPEDGSTTHHAVAYTTTTLTGTLRYFTFGSPHYSEKGWPMACFSVRNGTRRVPYWASYDWKNYNYVYTGFGTDCTYAQMVVNVNGLIQGTTPIINLPGPQDIAGPNAMWDDGSYYFGVSFYVAIFSTPYLVIGPSVGGGNPSNPVTGGDPGLVPGVGFDSSGSPGSAATTIPSSVQGGSGGGINPSPSVTGGAKFYAQIV